MRSEPKLGEAQLEDIKRGAPGTFEPTGTVRGWPIRGRARQPFPEYKI